MNLSLKLSAVSTRDINNNKIMVKIKTSNILIIQQLTNLRKNKVAIKI